MYTRKTKEEIFSELENLQNESLFREFSYPLYVGGTAFTRTELWLLAKELVKDVCSRTNRDMFILEYKPFCRKEFMDFFSYIPDISERETAARKTCDTIFIFASIMIFHCMTYDKDISDNLTYATPAIRYFDMGYIDDKRYKQEYKISNVYESIYESFDPCFNDIEYSMMFREDYDEYKNKDQIQFDYNYCTGERLIEPVTKAVNNVRVPLPKKHNNIFVDEDTASRAYLFIREKLPLVQNAYDWCSFYMFFKEKHLFKRRTSVKKFCEQMNLADWFGDEIDKKCKEATLKNFSSLLRLNRYDAVEIDNLVADQTKINITKAATDSIMHLFRKLKTNWNY